MVGGGEVDAQGGCLEGDEHHGDVGAGGEVGNGGLALRHGHAAIQAAEGEAAAGCVGGWWGGWAGGWAVWGGRMGVGEQGVLACIRVLTCDQGELNPSGPPEQASPKQAPPVLP